MIYSVGQVIPSFINHAENVKFDIANDGAMLVVFFRDPKQHEIDQFKAREPFEIRFLQLHGVIFLTVKVGSLAWMDAPYNPHLSKNLTELQYIDNGQGLAMQLVLVDAVTGQIKHMRLLGLSERFTLSLYQATKEELEKPFDYTNYTTQLSELFQNYTTKRLVLLSKDYCKLS